MKRLQEIKTKTASFSISELPDNRLTWQIIDGVAYLSFHAHIKTTDHKRNAWIYFQLPSELKIKDERHDFPTSSWVDGQIAAYSGSIYSGNQCMINFAINSDGTEEKEDWICFNTFYEVA